MRKNSRDELSGAVRDETVAEFRRQEKEVPPATSRPFRLTPMLPPRCVRTFLIIRPLQFIPVHLVLNEALDLTISM